jgi:aspartyl-tRNA(Asn)/glutamyl-tRNA(Gln) amidotransferase subunit A
VLAWSATVASERIRRKEISPVELTRACLAQIERLNPILNAFITITPEMAMAQARELEAEQKAGKYRSALHGIPIALKDNIDTAGVRTTAASLLFADRVPDADAEVVRRLKAAGAIILGKLNLHEFAAGGTSVVSYFGAVRNPWDTSRSAGGSSGGSGAAVAAGLCYAALGTDTAGSIRVPAAHCGIVGLKPTYGRVSNRGVIPMSWTLDHVGPMCRTSGDSALILQAIAGYDQRDPSSVDVPVPSYQDAVRKSVKPLRLGVPKAFFFDGLASDTAESVNAAIELLSRMTNGVREVTVPAVTDLLYLADAEAYAYHAPYLRNTPGLYQPSIRKRFQAAATVPLELYIRARKRVDELRRGIARVFESVDVLVTPTSKTLPYTIAEATQRENEIIAPEPRIPNTRAFNYFGIPTMSLPCGFSKNGLPIGLQVSSPAWEEARLLAIAHAYEQQTDWSQRRPLVFTSTSLVPAP